MTWFHVKRCCQTAMVVAWLPTLVLMTSLTMLLLSSLPTYDGHSSPDPGQVPHFVCTADGDGTIMRCVFSMIAQRES